MTIQISHRNRKAIPVIVHCHLHDDNPSQACILVERNWRIFKGVYGKNYAGKL